MAILKKDKAYYTEDMKSIVRPSVLSLREIISKNKIPKNWYFHIILYFYTYIF